MATLSDHDRAAVGPGPAGWLAGGVALLVLLVGTAILGVNGFLELVANGATVFVPLPLFDALLEALGPLAKGLLFALVAAAVPLAGALLALVMTRLGRLGPTAGLPTVILAGGVALLLAELVALPLFGQGVLGTAYRGDSLALQLPILVAALAYGLVLVGIVREAGTPFEALPVRAPTEPGPETAMTEPGPETSTTEPGPETATTEPAPETAAGDGRGDGPPEPPTPAVVTAGEAFGRRSFLGRALVAIGGVSLLASGAIVVSRVATAASKPLGSAGGRPPVDDFGVTPQVTPLNDFYVIGKDLAPTAVDIAGWRLAISGLVDRPAEWTLDDLSALPRVEGYRTLQCISNEVVRYGSLIGNQWWAGVRVRDVLDAVGVQADARWVLWRSADGYTESLPLEVARDDGTWLVSEMGEPGSALPRSHGFPLRVLVAGRYGMKQPKYLTGMELAAEDEAGYWERRGWDETAAVRTYSRIDSPADGDDVPAGQAFRIYGIASAGDRGIARVEVSPDDGASWLDAELEPARPEANDLTWRRWRAEVTIATAGRAVLLARATDGAGNVQDPVVRSSLPSGATGLHRVTVAAVG
jgi:DMSO/TMAO reductase YedYZ molybdopterin-dependent catalytic subunit